MARVTIIPDDNTVLVDGEAREISMAGIDPTIHAVQWFDTAGEIEYNDGKRHKKIFSISPFQVFIDRWTAAGPPPPGPDTRTDRQKIIDRLRGDPVLKAQVIDSFEARGITDKQQMLAALEAKFADTI